METAKVLDHTNGVTQILDGGDDELLANVATLLGPNFQLPKAGIIRPGIMKLKSTATKQDIELYNNLVQKGLTWDEIDKKLGLDNYGKSKLIPANVDYFSIRPADCENPDAPAELIKLYGDPDGKLRSFPVYFPVNEWSNIIPHSLRCFGTNGIKFRSNFKNNGVRICEYPLELQPKVRVFGGRSWGERPCEPELCAEYQKGECKLGGVIQFYIPGIKGAGVWILPTTSWYSLVRIKSTLEMISRLTGGRIAFLNVDGKTPFYLRKIYDEISTIDYQTGKPVKRNQWLITLECRIDMFQLVQTFSNPVQRGLTAVNVLNGNGNPELTPKQETTNPEPVESEQKEIVESAPEIKEAAKPINPEPAETAEKVKPEKKAEPEPQPEPPITKEETEKVFKETDKEEKKPNGLVKECLSLRDAIIPEYAGYSKKVRGTLPKKLSENELLKLRDYLLIAVEALKAGVPEKDLLAKIDIILDDPARTLKAFPSIFKPPIEDEDDLQL